MVERVIAVDWSGSASNAAEKIALAEVDVGTGQVVRLERGGTVARSPSYWSM